MWCSNPVEPAGPERREACSHRQDMGRFAQPRRLLPHLASLAVIWMALVPGSGQAIILIGTGDPNANTTAPTGRLADSGWQWTGLWEGLTGTPIGPSSFLTAAHFGGQVGHYFEFGGRRYRTVAMESDPASDLRIWHVCGEFGVVAPLDRSELAPGAPLMVLGRGTQRGAEVTVSRFNRTDAVGWKWGPGDGRLRWGTNTVSERIEGAEIGAFGPLLRAEFNRSAGNDECQLSTGDSGGPVFTRRTDGWRLAGINYAAEGEYRTSPEGTGFMAAIFDAGGLYVEGETGWSVVPPRVVPQPSGWYCTRVAPRMAWIDQVLAQAPPPAQLEGSAVWPPDFEPFQPLAHDPQERYFEVPNDGSNQWFRLIGPTGIRVGSVQVVNGRIRLNYE
jgi:hypothetical protein